MDHRLFQDASGPLLAWFQENARDLPWRRTRDPYKIWVSEIMLQQTRVAAVLGYYARFLEAFPTVEALAAGSGEKLLSLWQGLGYYSRARNLERAAERIVEQGGFPNTYEAIRALPGVGDYTAGAIASAAYGLPRAAVDGNVLRVAARLWDWREPVSTPAVRRTVAAALEASFPSGEDAYIYNQAWMELGAVVCVPNGSPDCGRCPVSSLCLGRARGTAESLPVRAAKRPRRVEERTVFVLLRETRPEDRTKEFPADRMEKSPADRTEDRTEERTEAGTELRTAVRKRPARGLLAGLWEFPGAAGTLDEAGAAAVLDGWGLSPSAWESRLTAKHIFTHVEWHMTGYVLRVADSAGTASDNPFRWIGRQELDEYAIPSAFARFRERAAEAMDSLDNGKAPLRGETSGTPDGVETSGTPDGGEHGKAPEGAGEEAFP